MGSESRSADVAEGWAAVVILGVGLFGSKQIKPVESSWDGRSYKDFRRNA